MPWMLAARQRLQAAFGGRLVDLVPSYTTLMVHYDLTALSPSQSRELIAEALIDLSPNARTSGQCHVLPVWYDLSVGPELTLLAQRSGMAVEEVIEMQGLSLDPTSHRVMTGENPLDMGPTEFKLLHFFMTHPERVYSREQLLNNVWGTNVYVEDRTVDVHIRRLRKALELSGHDRMVQTVRGTGYRFSTRF